ncbi:YbaB/EbfC family nucleoid-associated protein [Saccharothrix deserti]|uniref:YbaB/EbfC family nucleoid-associated protein n=1 Tax=Saccharothrix deserti TaxID=2593674 RepID=UPI00131C45B2|nr:YbaB/EbfC family nucleoid-associated protein [Saccharothrix deserti]
MNPVDYERIADEVKTIQRRLAEIRATAESDDGLVRAVVGGRGEVIKLDLDPRIYRTADSAALATTITGTIHRAVARAQGEVFALVRRFLPADATPATADLDFDPFLTSLDRASEWGGR